jgi:hypothetical protein
MLPPATAGSLKAFAQMARCQAARKISPEKQEADRLLCSGLRLFRHCGANNHAPSFSEAVWPLLAASSSQTNCTKLRVALILCFADL